MACTTQVLESLDAHKASVTHRLSAFAQRLWKVYWERRAERATIALLHSLHDGALRDIGVNRSEIESVVRSRSTDRIRRFDRAA